MRIFWINNSEKSKKGDYSKLTTCRREKEFATLFSLLGKPLSVLQTNRRITSGLGIDWEPLVLLLAPNLGTMSIKELCALLLSQEARRSFVVVETNQTSQCSSLSQHDRWSWIGDLLVVRAQKP